MFEHLPDAAQALICPLASTPPCPTHVLLARVSKLWGAAASKHFRLDGGGITLQLPCAPSSPTEDLLRELDRLKALAAWLRQQGHAVTTFSIQTSSDGRQPGGYVSGRSYGVSNLLEALAAAGQRSGGLRLQHLQVPAIGLTTPTTLARALSGCHQLRQLQLDPDCGIGRMGLQGYLDKDFCRALQQLTQLTQLKLYASDRGCPRFDMDGLLGCLPRSLEVLDMGICCSWTAWSTSSLQHLVALRQLMLPWSLIWKQASTGHALQPLTALTYLDFCTAMSSATRVLPALPNLVELWTGPCDPDDLQQLSSKTALRSLACILPLAHHGAGALAQLTQLTRLKLGLYDHGITEQAISVAAITAALSCLKGLRSLGLQAGLLEELELAPLTALSRLEVCMQAFDSDVEDYDCSRLGALLASLAPAQSQLQEVVLVGVPATQQAACRAAVATALGDVSLDRIG